MKKLIIMLICLSYICTNYAHEHNWIASLKQGYFIPQEKILRDIFNGHGSKGGYFIEGALRYNVWNCLYVELNGSYFEHKGRALVTTISSDNTYKNCSSCSECVDFKMPTVGLGLKYYWWFRNDISFFLGGGLKGFFVHIKNDSLYVPHHDNQSSAGGFIHTGFLFNIHKGFSLELFADYLGSRIKCPWQTNTSLRYKLNVSGFAGGIGLDYSF
jgi:hypothetical protein